MTASVAMEARIIQGTFYSRIGWTSSQILTTAFMFRNFQGETPIGVWVKSETIRLSQRQIAKLLEIKIPVNSKHLKNIFDPTNFRENMVISKKETATRHHRIFQIVADLFLTIQPGVCSWPTIFKGWPKVTKSGWQWQKKER